jgi:hypothetical protein
VSTPVAGPDRLAVARIVTAALFLTSLAMLAIAFMLRPEPDRVVSAPAPFVWVAVAYAVLSPLIGALVTQRLAGGAGPDVLFRAAVVRAALSEAAVFLVAVAYYLGAPAWTLAAAAVPLMAMVATFPRG